MAADVQMLYYDLGAVSDLAAAVTANRFTGPVKEQESEFLLTQTGSSPSAGTRGFLPNTRTALYEQPASACV